MFSSGALALAPTFQGGPQGQLQPSISQSPRTSYAVYIMVLRDSTGVLNLLGTAFAVRTPSCTVAMTCAHCIWKKDENGLDCRCAGEIFLASRVERDDNGRLRFGADVEDEVFRMNPIHHNTADICLLQIDTNCPENSAQKFSITIPICPSELMPKSSRDEYEVKVYQAPMTTFSNLDLPSLDIATGAWCKVQMKQPLYFYVQSVSAPGSSGGPVINRLGYAVGMVKDGYLPTLSVDLLPHVSQIDSVSQWSGSVSNKGQIAHYSKVVLIDGDGHGAYQNLLATV